jgi:hypothetical protein
VGPCQTSSTPCGCVWIPTRGARHRVRPHAGNGATAPIANNMRRPAGTQVHQRQPAAPIHRRCARRGASTILRRGRGWRHKHMTSSAQHLKREASAHARSGAARSACCRESAHCKAVGRHACREEERCSEQQGGRAHRHGAHRHGGLRTKSL